MNLDYSQSREDNEITLKTSEPGSWFVLRLHDEEIDEVECGTETKLEDNAYLIYAEVTTVKIQVKEPGLHYDVRKD